MNAPSRTNEFLPTNVQDIHLSQSDERILTLLGQGIEPRIVAAAVGVSESYISQKISESVFAARVAELRYETLAAHSVRDNKYDDLEDSLIERMKNCLPMMYNPMEVLAAVRVINGAKRRGAAMNPSAQSSAPVVQLTMPIQIINQYRMNINNQVIRAGQQDLTTVQSGSMKTLLSKTKEAQNVEILPRAHESVSSNG
jgi:hypothetical protein